MPRQINSAGFNLAANDHDIPSVENASDRDHVGGLSEYVWAKAADWFCDTRREQAKALLFELMSDATDGGKKADCFRRLRELAASGFTDRFQISSNYVERGEDYSLCLDGQENGIRFTVQGDYLKKLKEWEDAAPPGEFRTEVANQLQHAYLIKAQVFVLDGESITSLPELPDSLQTLHIGRCTALGSLPEQWPASLSELYVWRCPALDSLPEHWPASLQTLRIRDCEALASLPEHWPASLQELRITYCDVLASLPEHWPASLRVFRIGDCPELDSLPEYWPASLQVLRIEGCEAFVSLPEHWPASLQALRIDDCEALESLPGRWPASLQTVWIEGCEALASLPAHWPDSLQRIYVGHCEVLSALPERAPASLSRLIIWRCPKLEEFDSAFLPAQDWWYFRAGALQDDLALFRRSWEAIVNEDDYPSFQALLDRLRGEPLVNYVKPLDVVEVIKGVIESNVARAQILEQSQSAAQNCEDRPLTIFNTVQSIARFSRLQHEQAPVAELLGLAEGMLKTALLDEATIPVMRKQWEEGRRFGNDNRENPGPNLSEALEVQLELRRALGDELGLPFVANSRYSEGMAQLNDSDKQFVTQFVQARMADMDSRISGLISIPMWAFYVKQQCQVELEAIYDKYWNLLERLEDEKERLNSQEYDEGYRQLKAAREAEINGVLFMRTRAIATGQPVLTF